MFTIRVHSVDTDHPLFLSPPSAAAAPDSDPKLTERRGLVHLFRALRRPPENAPASATLFIVAVPNYFSSDDLLRFFGSQINEVSEFLIIRNDGMEDRYSVLIRTQSENSADRLYNRFNGKRFSPPEVEICHVLSVSSADFTEIAEIAGSPPIGYVELPTCPVCLERLDQDTSGIQTTLCDHSFQCSCISKWTYLSCQVCRLCQQKDEKPTCSVCDSSENLWTCVICGFVGCGRYKEGHTIGHWKDTQHCYSLDLETQRVWDYVGDNYVHRLNQSKLDGKSVAVDSSCLALDGDCGTCASEDSDIGGALFESKVEAIMDEYNRLLATQLDNQRQYYETLLAEARGRKETAVFEAVEAAMTRKVEELQSKLERYQQDKKTVSNMNQCLLKGQEAYKKKMTEMIGREISSLCLGNEKIQDLEEQIRDLKVYLHAQRTLRNSEEGKGGTLLPVPLDGSAGKTNRRRRN